MPTQKEMLDALLASMESPDEESQNVTGIIYGDNGGGKTVTAVRLAQAIRKHKEQVTGKKGRVLFIDAVNARRSLKNHPELLEGLQRVKYEGKVQLDLIIDAIEFRPAGFEDFTVVVLDEMSSMTDKDGDTVLLARSNADKSKDPDVLTQPDMGATTERMRRSVIRLLQQDISVIFVAHVREDEDKAKGFKVIRPRFMPKFSGTIREGLDFVSFMYAEESGREGNTIHYGRFLQSWPTRTIVAKTRVGTLGMIETPDDFVRKIIDWLSGGKTSSISEDSLTVVDDTVPNVSEDSDDFVGVVVQD